MQVTGQWAFGTALCHIIPMVFGVIVYASTLSLTVIAVDRFALIVVGVKRRLSPRVALALVLVIAAFSATAEDRREPSPTVSDRRRLSPTVADRRRRALVLVIAAFSTVVALPMALFSRHVVYADPVLRIRRRMCEERWPSTDIRKLYTVAPPPLPVVAASS